MSQTKKVYQLSDELAGDPEQVAAAQRLTLDESRPYKGLKGSHGLFGSSQWWANVASGVMPTKRVSGEITRVYVAGQERSAVPNAFDLLSDEGQVRMEGIFVNAPADVVLFQVGRRVEVVYVLDELKLPSTNGDANYSEIVLEVSISLE